MLLIKIDDLPLVEGALLSSGAGFFHMDDRQALLLELSIITTNRREVPGIHEHCAGDI